MKLEGTVFKYGDNVDTDVIIPARYLNSSDPKELASHCMEDIDKEFVKKVQAGDIIVSTNGTETLTMHQLASVLNQAEPGDTGNLKIMRQTSGAYEEMAVEITFGS